MRFHFKTDYDHDIRLFPDLWTFALYATLFAVMFALPLLIDSFYLGEATNILIWAVLGLGLMLLTGQTGQVSLGHSAFMALGCYSCVLLMESGWPFVLAFLFSGLITGVIGAIVAVPALRLHGVYLAIATLAIAIIADDLIVIMEPLTGGVAGKFAPQIFIAGFEFNRWANATAWYYLALVVALLVALGYRNLLRSPMGRAFAAVRDSEVSAQAMGINVARTKTLAFGLSCMITGWGGALMGLFAEVFNNETFNFLLSIQILMLIVVGGLGSIHGAFMGAVVIAFMPMGLSILGDVLGRGGVTIPGLEMGVFGVILILFIIFEPMGLYGRWVKMRIWLELFPFARKDMFRRQKSYLKTERLR